MTPNFFNNSKPGLSVSLSRKTSRTVLFLCTLFLFACGEQETNNQADVSPANHLKTTTATTLDTTSVIPVDLNLNTRDIDKQTFLGLVIPEEIPAAPCPYLADESALVVVKTNWKLKRRETSNEVCYWSKNAGFSIKLTVEPLASAKPLSERAYNLDTPPVIINQPAPGNNAVVLYDTAWDKEQAYAIAFEQANKLVMLYVTGMNTDAARLTAAAKEVSSKLSSGATVATLPENAAAFDMCSIWSESEVADIIGMPVQTTSNKDDCEWETGSGDDLKQVRVGVYYGKNHTWDYLIELGAKDVPGVGESAMLDSIRKKPNMPAHVKLMALNSEKLVTVTVTQNIADYESVAVALSKNIDQRLK